MSSNKVYVIGYGLTKFGELYNQGSSSLAAQALTDAITNSQADKNQIQTAFFGSLVSSTNSQPSIGASCIRNCNLNIPITRIEAGNASGAAAFYQAYLSILSGVYNCTAVVGVEKLSDYVQSGVIERILGSTIDYQWEFEMGATLTSLYAILTKEHMKKFGTTLEQLASVPAKNHKNGVHNPQAQFRREIKIENFLKAKRISDPIGRFDPATYCDGAAALILASSKYIEDNSNISTQVPILGSGQASDSLALHHRDSLTTISSSIKAADVAFSEAKLSPKDINFAEVHDSYPIGEILAIEDLGFFSKGEGGKATQEGLTELNAKISVNPSGGLKSRGDPFGATGVAQIAEVVEQMKGNAGQRQVSENNYGLTQNVIGTGVMSYINIFGKDEVKK